MTTATAMRQVRIVKLFMPASVSVLTKMPEEPQKIPDMTGKIKKSFFISYAAEMLRLFQTEHFCRSSFHNSFFFVYLIISADMPEDHRISEYLYRSMRIQYNF